MLKKAEMKECRRNS